MRGEENLKSVHRRPKRQRPRMSEDDILILMRQPGCVRMSILAERSKN